jgi:hypothetical protein
MVTAAASIRISGIAATAFDAQLPGTKQSGCMKAFYYEILSIVIVSKHV